MVSVIIPTFNRFEIIQETIQNILAINTTIVFEIIVVNDGEDLPFTITHPKLTIYKNPKKGVSSARNYGASHAKYDLLFFIDDDMWITKESLISINSLIKDVFFESKCLLLNWKYPNSLVGQMKHNKIGRYLIKANYHTLEGRLGQHINNNVLLMQIATIGSGSFVINKRIFNLAGKYDENILFSGEDVDLSNKLNECKIDIYLYTSITCYHNQKDRLDIDNFLDRDFRAYLSLFKSNKIIIKSNSKKMIYSILIPFNSIFLFTFKILPNMPIFDFFTFRIISTLSSIIYFKAWSNAKKERINV